MARERVGRPLKFKSPDELQEKIDAYFANVVPRQYTITGLAIALDVDRDTLLNYQDKPEFFGTIKRAKTKIEWGYELTLRERGSSGDIFGLKNFGWTDKTEQDITSKGEQIMTGSNLTEQEMRERLRELTNEA